MEASVFLGDALCKANRYSEARYYYRAALQRIKEGEQHTSNILKRMNDPQTDLIHDTESLHLDSNNSLSTPLSIILKQEGEKGDTIGTATTVMSSSRNTMITKSFSASNGKRFEEEKRIKKISLIERLLTTAEIPGHEDYDDQQKCLQQLCSYDLRNANLR